MSGYLESEKRKIRHEFLALRNRMDADLAAVCSAGIFAGIKKLSAYEKAKTVMFYLSYDSEVVTDFMINSAFGSGKIVVIPLIKNFIDEEMYAVKISRLEDACLSVYGIRQPDINSVNINIVEKDNIDLVFVPGLAFDIKGHRTGYGKGCYDRWLKSVPFEKIVGLAYDFQVTKQLPIGEYDIPVSIIVTEKRVIQIKEN
ncbi:MAG: 5-formyltetrahydrofolate cyclo-ligase [Candidatus Endomicrobiellum trichonymphae]|uniref:5-formyltetrahydrofolate cyclo-ligase n=1 Tax=Endomicrobium trichonymphae TaxID=1408204 RepID=UPI0027D399E5|nr:MAG: 5-formyltetrahydrofolate cyclo-ligase [Candidatus Endomicrobium trichonymphae]